MGQSDVKIVLTAVDNASQTLNKVGGSFKTMGLSLTDLWSGVNLAKQGFEVLKAGIDKTVGVTVDYNKQIREMSQVTGLGAEEISRIVQVGDDWGIEIGTLRTSLAYMNKQGIKPSIENLANLADEYVNTKDKTAFAEKAAKLLGRQYQTLIPLFAKGGDALRTQTAAINENLIATDASIQAARDYEVATDNLSDAFLAQKIAIGNELLPVLSQMLTPAVNETIDGQVYLVKTIGDTTTAWVREGNVLVDVTGKYALLKGMSSEARMEAQKGYDTSSLEELGGAAGTAAGELKNVHLEMVEVSKASIAADAISMINAEFDKGTMPTATYEALMASVGVGLLGLSTNEVGAVIALANIKKGFEDGNVPLMSAVEQMYKIVGAVGTDFPNAQAGADPAFDALETDFGSAQEYVAATTGEVNTFSQSLRDIPTKIDIYITTHYVTEGDPTPGNPRQGGGPVQRNTPYIVGERGPELFVPGTAGRIIPNDQLRGRGGSSGGSSGDIYANFYITPTSNQSPRAIAREVLAMLGEAQRYASAGGYYQGV